MVMAIGSLCLRLLLHSRAAASSSGPARPAEPVVFTPELHSCHLSGAGVARTLAYPALSKVTSNTLAACRKQLSAMQGSTNKYLQEAATGGREGGVAATMVVPLEERFSACGS